MAPNGHAGAGLTMSAPEGTTDVPREPGHLFLTHNGRGRRARQLQLICILECPATQSRDRLSQGLRGVS